MIIYVPNSFSVLLTLLLIYIHHRKRRKRRTSPNKCTYSTTTTTSDILQTVPSVDISHTIPSSSSEDDSSIGQTPVLMGMFKEDKESCYVHWRASEATDHSLQSAEKYATIASARGKEEPSDNKKNVKFFGTCYSSSNLEMFCSPSWRTRRRKSSAEITGNMFFFFTLRFIHIIMLLS